jgi:hypothetical protein
MGEHDETYSLYRATTDKLLNQDAIRQDPAVYRRALRYQQRLTKNLEQSQSQGDTDELRAERCRIINELNKLTAWKLKKSFTELCAQLQPAAEREFTECLPHINDPLCSARPRLEGSVGPFLREIIRTRWHTECEEALCLCKDAVTCASKHGASADLAMAYLYQADALARNEQFKPAIKLAERAKRILEIKGDRHNVLIAQLLIAHLHAAQDQDGARPEYLEALSYCRRLEGEKRKSGQNQEVQLYQQIIEEIQMALEDVDREVRALYPSEYRRNPIPVLQLSDGPDVIFHPVTVMYRATTGEFKMEGSTYLLYPIKEMAEHRPEVKEDAVHFALPVPEDGWLIQTSRGQDYALARQETQTGQEGPAVSWIEQRQMWVGGRFERNSNTDRIHFVGSKPHIIGDERTEEQGEDHGLVIGLLKPIQ